MNDERQSGAVDQEAFEKVIRDNLSPEVLDRLVFIGAAIQSATLRERLQAASARCHAAHLAAELDQIPDAINDKTADWVYLRFLPPWETVERIHRAGKRIFLAGPLVAGNEVENPFR